MILSLLITQKFLFYETHLLAHFLYSFILRLRRVYFIESFSGTITENSNILIYSYLCALEHYMNVCASPLHFSLNFIMISY